MWEVLPLLPPTQAISRDGKRKIFVAASAERGLSRKKKLVK